MLLTKEYPHEHKVVFKFKLSPVKMLHCFGESPNNFRNGAYSTKEWDFVDSNLDRFLIYDYKASLSYQGFNPPLSVYDVKYFNF